MSVPPVLFSAGPVDSVEVSLGDRPMPAGYKEVSINLVVSEDGSSRLANVHLFIKQEALEQLVRQLRSVKNSTGVKK